MEQQISQLEQNIHSLLKDPLLSDVTTSLPTEQELDDLIALELDHAYNIEIHRGPLTPINIIVRQATTVRDIKILFQQKWKQLEENKRRSVSWKYIWRTFCLELNNQKLLKDEAIVSQLGIQQGSILKFARLPYDRNKHQKAWRWSR
ncbi:uncharacterized protein BX664DRAFT_332531 [Halteromyces radiatus]|uniref:uncharacterized protein n=1 Tax=Halteromyces radiatus TaxID=101107 RepID=UPI0022210BA9|nr:uncharacterized protein BX664DRAFT_332531 [Halteromyces radiatus]KAI8089253.1 hypothetical protein BX664DRAFT_332531 [Halteromyces radiatus]